jgi:hypothetical protein
MCEKGTPFLNCHIFKCPSQNNRLTMRNSILAKLQTSSLINQRCRLSFITICVSLSHAVCGCWSTLSSVLINTRTHTLYLSLSLRYLALFPHLSVLLKSSLCDCLMINWNTDFTVLGCSHFISSINTKYNCVATSSQRYQKAIIYITDPNNSEQFFPPSCFKLF